MKTLAKRIRFNTFYTLIALLHTAWWVALRWVLVYSSATGLLFLTLVGLWMVMLGLIVILWYHVARLWWWEVEEWQINRVR